MLRSGFSAFDPKRTSDVQRSGRGFLFECLRALRPSAFTATFPRHKVNFSHYQCDLLHKVSKETATLTIAPRPGGEGYGDFALARSASGPRLRAWGRM
jgi:hypothetical protein